MRNFTMTITQADGVRLRYLGIYSDGCTAVIDAIDTFPNAKRISARRLP